MTKIIRFAHLADLHLGGWREKNLTHLNFITFQKAIKKIIEEKVDLCIFAGDIFNNALPPIELVNLVVKELMKLKLNNIPLYVIGGSHDYSFTGKSYIDLLESAHVLIDVSKYEFIDKNTISLQFTKDKSGAVLSGVLGKKNGLDKNIYSNLNKTTLSDENFNIFVFHTTLNDLKPESLKNVNSEVNSSYLPSGFDYYAGGHLHAHIEKKVNNSVITYPGPLFPNNFSEMIKEVPSFNLCEFDFNTRQTKINRIFIETYKKIHIKIELKENSNPIEAKAKIMEIVSSSDVKDKIVLLEIIGIVEPKISDINLNEIVFKIYQMGAQHVLKNTSKLVTNKVETILVYDDTTDVEVLEHNILTKNFSLETQIKEIETMKRLLKLSLEKQESEKISQYEQRINLAFEKSLN